MTITDYQALVQQELDIWGLEMRKKPSLFDRASKNLQERINRKIPEKVHRGISLAFRELISAVLSGSAFVGDAPRVEKESLQTKDLLARDKINFYKRTAAAEGTVTGAGGILLGLADLPLWLGIKMKMLSSIAAVYGFDLKDYKERIFLLQVFQLTFSGRKHRKMIYDTVANWEAYSKTLPEDIKKFDWQAFQQEYRDFLDIAKLLQLIPGVGAFVGAYVNHRYTERLGRDAINAYRLRLINGSHGNNQS